MNRLRVLCIDPGLLEAGWGIVDWDIDTGKLTCPAYGEINPNAVAGKAANKAEAEKYTKRVIALANWEDRIRKLILEYKPDVISCEDCYCVPGRINAYDALLSLIYTLKMLLYKEFQKPLFMVPTKIAKQSVTGDGGADKLEVRDKVCNQETIIFRQPPDPTELVFHVSDAIAVGIGTIRFQLPGVDLALLRTIPA